MPREASGPREPDEVDRPRDLVDAVYAAMDDGEPVRVIVEPATWAGSPRPPVHSGVDSPWIQVGALAFAHAGRRAWVRSGQPLPQFRPPPLSRAGSHGHRDGLLLTHEHDQAPAASQA